MKRVWHFGKRMAKTQFVLFCFFGGLSTILNYGVFAGLYWLGVQYLVAGAAGYVSGVLFSFTFNQRVTFKSHGETTTKLVKYFGVYTFSLGLSLLLLWLLVDITGIHPLIANVLVIGVTTLTNFFGCKLFVFT